MSKTVLEVRNVSKVLGSGAAQVRALQDIDLTLHGGELILLMGPSGSGKTTLLSVLGCMLAPSGGTVQVCGRSTAGYDAEGLADLRRRHIGFVFQSYHLFPTLTASENVQLALDVRGEHGAKARERARDALTSVGLEHKIQAYPREMSGGEQQRVAIARAIVSGPSAVLADEPTAALDGSHGHAIMSILATIAQDAARGVLVVTHDARLKSFADRIISIEDGRLVGEQCRRGDQARYRTAASGRHRT